MSQVDAKLPKAGVVDSSKPNLQAVRLIPEFDPAALTSQRQSEIDNLVVQIILAGKRRGRPRKKDRSGEE